MQLKKKGLSLLLAVVLIAGLLPMTVQPTYAAAPTAITSVVWNEDYSVTAQVLVLDTPTNLRWDGVVATWDAVPNADQYNVNIYQDKNDGAGFKQMDAGYNTSNTQYNFVSKFCVQGHHRL